MQWIFIALLAALFNALKNIFVKKVSNHSDQYTVAWISGLLSLPFLYVVLLYNGFPSVNLKFWLLIIFMMPFEIIVKLLFFKAIKDSALSKVVPFVSFLPLFVALSAFLILGESLSSLIVLAVILLSSGAYILNVDQNKQTGILTPFKSFLTSSGSLLIFIVTLIILPFFSF